MTTDELLVLLDERGLSVGWKEGKPCLHGPREMVTTGLLRVLAFHRDELIRRFPDAPVAQTPQPEPMPTPELQPKPEPPKSTPPMAPESPPAEVPSIVYWKLRHVVLTSLPRAEGVHRRISKPFVPYGAEAFAWRCGEWHPLSLLPASWGLKPLDVADIPVAAEDEDDDGHSD